MSDQPIRVGIIGGGGNTRKHHIPKLQAQPGVEVVSIANRSRESGARVAAEFSIPEVADHWQAIIADDRLDAVCIGTWPYMHAPITIAALEAGKHVLCEARMARNAAEARRMLEISRAHPNLTAQIVPSPLTLPYDQTIVETIASGAIGSLISLNAELTPGSDFPDVSAPYHWRHDRDYSGNNIMSMGIWYEAFMRWIGPAATVQAIGQSVVLYRLDEQGKRRPTSIPDHVHILSQMQQGGQLHMMVSSVVGHAPGVDIRLYGSEGTLRLSGSGRDDLVLHRGTRGGSLEEVSIEPVKRGDWRVEEEFINAIRGKEPVTHTDFASGLHYMEWTDGVTESMVNGERVDLRPTR